MFQMVAGCFPPSDRVRGGLNDLEKKLGPIVCSNSLNNHPPARTRDSVLLVIRDGVLKQ